MGAAAIVPSGVPLSCTATALSEISYSLVTVAPGAFARSHRLNSFRPAFNWARYDLTALLLKSIFLPRGGLVRGSVLSGAPLSWTIALELSTSGLLLKESAFGLGLVFARLPTPKAIMPKAIEEDIRNTMKIFFMVFVG